MISRYDIIKAFEKIESMGETNSFKYDKTTDSMIDRETGERICSLDLYVEYIASKLHCNFEVIYSEHASLQTIYRCRDCGTVIFGGDDERWDPNLCCPVCGEYKTWLEYWSGEDIKNDPEKQKEIAGIIEMQKYLDECEARHQKRGKYDWELWNKTIHFKKSAYKFEFKIENITNKFKLKGLELNITPMKKENIEDCFYTHCSKICIPLSFKSLYLNYIFPYSKKCPTELRRYYFWQKKIVETVVE